MPKINLIKPTASIATSKLLQKKRPNQRHGENAGIEIGEVPKGLVPLGDTGLWITPDEPADPQDCDRYPTSPYCTADFFTLSPVTLVPSIAVDSCNAGIRLDGSIGWLRVPPIAIIYRDPSQECDPSYSPPEEPPPPPPTLANRRPFAVAMPRHPDCIGSALFHCHRTYDVNTGAETIHPGSPPNLENYHEVRSQGMEVDGNEFQLSELRANFPDSNNRYAFIRLYISPATYYPSFLSNGYLYHPYSSDYPFDLVATSLAFCPQAPPLSIFQPPPPPIDFNPLPRDCCMSCCPSSGEPDNSLLNLLIEKVDKLSKVVGVDDYPVSLPTSLISKDEGFLGSLIPNFNEDVPSLTRFLSWYVERFDEIMGQWEIPIEVKDSDPTKPGDQPVGFKLPNMAEAIAEMFGLMLQTSINSQILVNMNTRTMLEVGQNKQQIFKTYMLTLAIADHMGFEYKEVKHKIPMLFDISQDQLDKLLVEAELETTAVEYTDSADLKIVLTELLQAAAIIRAVHFRKFDVKGDVKGDVAKLIKGLVATSDLINDAGKNDQGADRFDDFLEDAERGFTTASGITDTDHPYGRNFNERPRIKEIGQDTAT